MAERLFVKKGIEYLTEWDGFELPHGILNKSVTGCGATSLALEDRHKTLLLCPRVNLVVNKHSQYRETTFMVNGDVKNVEIEEYIESAELPKIIATYDAAERIAGMIEDKSEWRVVVDEYQYLLIDSEFKAQIENSLLDSIRSFPYVTYLSATPIAHKYICELPYFDTLPYYELVWEEREKIEIVREISKSPVDAALSIVRDYQHGNYPRMEVEGRVVESTECVIFLNSVNNIVNIVKQTELKPDEVNIIVGKGSEDEVKKIGKGFMCGRIPLKDEPHKKFTFCTSTAFAGCDFYSTCASTFIISDSRRGHTSIDIATELAQIVGRQRLAENHFRKVVTFIYNMDEGTVDREVFYQSIEEKWNTSMAEARSNNNETNISLRNKRIKDLNSDIRLYGFKNQYTYYDDKTDRFEVNRLAYVSDLFAYDVQYENYRNDSIISNQLTESGFDVKETRYVVYKEQLRNMIRKPSFEERMRTYCNYRMKGEEQIFHFPIEQMERKYSDIKGFYNELGGARIHALGYRKASLEKELKKQRAKDYLTIEFRSIFKSGMRLTTPDIKKKMEEVYSRYGLDAKGVATHLTSKYGIEIKSCKIPLDDGRRTSGYQIL